MCGIAGRITTDLQKISMNGLKAMTDSIAHRGPDGEGQWISPNGMVGLGHRRLSIIDLSHEADQPMHYLDRYHLVYNGEIYNYLELKETLQKQGYSFTTASDSEVLLALYDRYNEDCLQLLDGMFAFVIYDEKKNELFVARDRFGEKPFFYNYIPGKHFLFGSEMKCLWAGGVNKEVNNTMLYNYLCYNHLDNPYDLSETFYENCMRLPHSHYIKLSVTDCKLKIKQYYDIDWRNINHTISLDQAKEKFRELFYTSVQRRLRSDVIVGSSLSGGLDSSLVVGVIDNLKKGTGLQQDTFSAVFPGFERDERKYMDHVIAKTNVSPHFITPNEQGLINSIEKLSWHQEEPFGSASIYVQYCVMQLAKENNITVLLDGQGADEVLAGYHAFYPPFFRGLKKTHPKIHKDELTAYSILHSNNNINPDIRRGFINRTKEMVGSNAPALRKLYHRFNAWRKPLVDPAFQQAYYKHSFDIPFYPQNLNEALYNQSFHHGLQELLRYADRNSMAHSREVRLPFLSHELVDFLFTLPASMKIHNGWTKWIMRKAFETELPEEIAWRKDKIGYEPPQKNWMENENFRKELADIKGMLVKEHILSPAVLEVSIENKSEDNWKLFMIGQLFKA